mmetsp:Transcript_6527/g.24510  ORF Transcript_6527/g.24510 Transcript_6527/m.24510 type:complete len:132 (-) Transcript_6527:340-735(-)
MTDHSILEKPNRNYILAPLAYPGTALPFDTQDHSHMEDHLVKGFCGVVVQIRCTKQQVENIAEISVSEKAFLNYARSGVERQSETVRLSCENAMFNRGVSRSNSETLFSAVSEALTRCISALKELLNTQKL